jgi:LuxR family maltose regulon positive regulatory protein
MRQRGQLGQVIEVCEQQLQMANECGLSHTAVAGGFLAIWGEVLAEIDDLAEASHRSKRGVELAECGEDMVVLGWSYLCLMRVLLTTGDMAEAEELIRKVENHTRQSDLPPWIPKLMAAWQARLWLAQDKLEAASQWVAERELGGNGELQFLRDFEQIVLARVLMAQRRLDETAMLLPCLLEAAEAGGHVSSVIEILVLQALALQAQGDTDQAIGTLENALIRAEPEGFVRIFLDEGQPMVRLLYEAASRGMAPDYVRRLLAAYPVAQVERTSPPESQSPREKILEPLSEREIEVLQLIAEGLTNQEIASRLFISLNTVKGHTRNIYGKLGVHSRTQAVARARVVGALSPI